MRLMNIISHCIGISVHWITWDRLAVPVGSASGAITFVVTSTMLFSFMVRFCVSLWLVVLSETIRAFLNFVCAQTSCSDSFKRSANKWESNLNTIGHEYFWCFLLSRIHWHGLSWRLTAFSIEFLTVLMATLSGILYITTLFREIIRLVTSLAIKSITDSTLILSSNSEVTISLDNSSRRGDSVFSSNLRSSCFNKEPASDST